MDPIRIELDFPLVLNNQYGHITVEGNRDLEDILSVLTPVGTTFTLHIVLEQTGSRPRCKFTDPDPNARYHSECGQVLQLDGTCTKQDQHNETEKLYQASQLTLELIELQKES